MCFILSQKKYYINIKYKNIKKIQKKANIKKVCLFLSQKKNNREIDTIKKQRKKKTNNNNFFKFQNEFRKL